MSETETLNYQGAAPPMRVGWTNYRRLLAIKEKQEQELDRRVTYAEIIGQLLDKAGAP